ncbi:MAG: tRNA 2-selenouridine(34) synthase MnmH [Pseudomonadota bacterium]
MAFEFTGFQALDRASFDAVIDVRSPSEYAKDHVPGSMNLPVLSDEERARVGTIYVQESPFRARKIGAALVARNVARHLEGPLAGMDGGWRPLVYCWRGGQRSGSFATILSQVGWRAETLQGGYRSYRRHVVDRLYYNGFSARLILLDGNTGTAKTELLGRLAARGVQTLDLEGMANHRGSALGAQGAQPSQKAFESRLAVALSALNPDRPAVVEAESSRIGRLNIPPAFFTAMKAAPRIEVAAPVAARAQYLCDAYADLIGDTELLVARLERLTPIQGHDRVRVWCEMARAGAHPALAEELIRAHYDPRYAKLRGTGVEPVSLWSDTLDATGIEALAGQIALHVGAL